MSGDRIVYVNPHDFENMKKLLDPKPLAAERMLKEAAAFVARNGRPLGELAPGSLVEMWEHELRRLNEQAKWFARIYQNEDESADFLREPHDDAYEVPPRLRGYGSFECSPPAHWVRISNFGGESAESDTKPDPYEPKCMRCDKPNDAEPGDLCDMCIADDEEDEHEDMVIRPSPPERPYVSSLSPGCIRGPMGGHRG